MEINIQNKYICKTSGFLKSSTRCSVHQLLDDPNLDANALSDFLKTIIPTSKPNFLKSFEGGPKVLPASKNSTTTDIVRKSYLVYLLSNATKWFTDHIAEPLNFEFEISKLYNQIFFASLDGTPHIKYLDEILQVNVKNFSKIYPNCICSHALLIDKKSVEKYQIHGRIDVVHKLLSKINFAECLDVEQCVIDTIVSVVTNLTRYQRPIIDTKLSEISRRKWTNSLKFYIYNTTTPAVYLDDHRNTIIYHPKDFDNIYQYRSIYLYKEEKVDPIYKIAFENHSYCLLCNKYQPYNRTIKILDSKVSIEDHTKPYICQQICDKLIIKYAANNATGTYDISSCFVRLRWVANRAVELNCGNNDKNSWFGILPRDIILIILQMYLDVI